MSTDLLNKLTWAANSRYRNQMCSVRLLELFVRYEAAWKTRRLSRAAQDLLAVAFSLWRAAFLANKTGRRAEVFMHGRTFLQQIIEDNAISYLQDKNSREWTFNYYTRNARSSLQILHEYWPNEVPPYEPRKRNAAERWEYCQLLLDKAVSSFGDRLEQDRSHLERVMNARTRRANRRTRRAIVRKMTLRSKAK
jgi:hypothetical protein